MKPGSFALYEPTSVAEAAIMLADVAEHDGRVLAGGQTLIPAMALRFARPAHLVDINRIAALRECQASDTELVIPAGVRHAAFHRPPVQGALGTLLGNVVPHIAHLPIRSRGTFCGSLANADPASEWCLVTTTLGARMQLRSTAGEREVAATDFFLGYMSTALRPDELLACTTLPCLPADTVSGFEEYSRRAGDFAQAMSLVVMRRAGNALHEVRIGVGGVEPAPRRIGAAEAILEGQPASDERCIEAARAAAAAVQPDDAEPAAQAYRRHLVESVVLRALRKALATQP